MTPEQFERASELFQQVRDLPPVGRKALLDRECGDDSTVLREVESLLLHDERPTSIVDRVDFGGGRDLLAADLASEDPAKADSWTPQQIDKYKIIREIGRGGMGIVYEAEQSSPRRSVALKVLSTGAANVQLFKRFKREADVLGRLHHPGIAKIYDAGVADVQTDTGISLRQPYFAMELISGERLDAFVRVGAPDLRKRIELFAKICDAVHHAHECGVIHRDLKPGNIFIEPGGEPRVLDFGVARPTGVSDDGITVQTDVGQLIGTVPYMSPEQLGGNPSAVDRRSDVYSLGVCLYEMLSGRLPHDVRGKLIHEAARIVIEDEQTSLSSIDRNLSGDIETIVGKALEKDPSRRYQTAEELAIDLRRYLSDEPVSARPPSTVYQLQKFARRNRAFVTAAIVAGLSLCVATIASTWWAYTASKARQSEFAQRKIADDTAALARANEQEMRRLAYSTSLSATLSNLAINPIEARRHLDLAPKDLRGWEWKYLSNRIGQPAVELKPPASVAWDEDGNPIAAFIREGTIRVVDMRSGRTINSFVQPIPDNQISISPDATLIMFNVGDDKGAAFDAITGDLRYEFEGWPDRTIPYYFPSESLFALIKPELRSITFRDLTTGRTKFTIEIPGPLSYVWASQEMPLAYILADNFVATIDVSTGTAIHEWNHDGYEKMYVESSDHSIRAEWSLRPEITPLTLMNSKDGNVFRKWQPHTGGTQLVAFSQSGRYLMTTGLDEQLRIWNVADGSQLSSVPIGNARWIGFGPAESDALAYGDNGALLLNWKLKSASQVIEKQGSYVYEVCYSPDGKLLASAGWDQTVYIHEVDTGELVHRLAVPCHHIGALGFSDDGKEIMALAHSGHWTSELVIWDVSSGRRIDGPTELDSTFNDDSEPIDNVDETTGNNKLAANWWRLARCGSKATRYDGGEHMAKSHNGKLLAHARYQSDLVILDLDTFQIRATLIGHEGTVRAVAFSQDDRLLASGGDDRTVRVWDVSSGRLIATMEGHSEKIFTVTFNPDGSRIASGGNDNVIRFWDTASFAQVFALPGHTSYIHSLAFSPDGRRLASGSGDKSVQLWDAGP